MIYNIPMTETFYMEHMPWSFASPDCNVDMYKLKITDIGNTNREIDYTLDDSTNTFQKVLPVITTPSTGSNFLDFIFDMSTPYNVTVDKGVIDSKHNTEFQYGDAWDYYGDYTVYV